MNPSQAHYQLLIVLIIIFSPLAKSYMPPYDSYFKDKSQKSVSDELSTPTCDSLPYSHQKLKDELSDCQSLVAALENIMNIGLDASVDDSDGLAVSAENRNAATELIHLRRLYSEVQTLLESANAKMLESQTEMDWLREALEQAHTRVSLFEQAKAEAETKLSLLERQLSEERDFSNKFLEESRRELESEYGKKFRWQEQRYWDLVSTKTYLDQKMTENESRYEETQAELLATRYELYNANERLRDLEHNRYKDFPRISLARSLAFLGKVKDLARESLPFDQLQSTWEHVETELSPLWHSFVAYIVTNLTEALPPHVISYQDLVISNTCELVDLITILFKLQAAPARIVSISQGFLTYCTEAVICVELGVIVIGFVFLVKYMVGFRKILNRYKIC